MKHVVVIKTSNNFRIMICDNIKPFIGKKDVFVDPDISHVRGIPPHFWTWNKDKKMLVAMTEEQKHAVREAHEISGVDNLHPYRHKEKLLYMYKRNSSSQLIMAGVGACVCVVVIITMLKHWF